MYPLVVDYAFSTLELNCLVFGDDSSHIFPVKILPTESVGTLKKVVKEDKSIPSNMSTWILSLSGKFLSLLTEISKKISELSDVFSESPVRMHLHIVVKAPPSTVTHPAPPSSTLQLFCYMRGDDYRHAFEVKIGMEESVAALREAIKKKRKPDLDRVRADSLVLWNVHIPLDENLRETVDELGLVDENLLSPFMRLSNVFPQQPADGNLQIIIKELPISIPQKRKLSEPPENALDRLKRAKIVMDAPLDTEKYQNLQGEPSEKIYDDRPEPDAFIPPIALLYEGFGHFLDVMKGGKNVPGLADIDVRGLQTEVDELASKMTGYFSNEDDRRNEALPYLDRIFSARRGIKIPLFSAAAIGSVRTDGHDTEIHIAGAMIVLFKNWHTEISAFPQTELVCYAARLCATRKNEAEDQLYLRWRIPFVALAIVGCDIRFYAIIAIDHRFRIVGLTSGLSFIPLPSSGIEDRTSLYSAFVAASVLQAHILQDTERLLNNPPPVIPAHARHFPAVSKLHKYPSSGGDYFSFEIQNLVPDRQPDLYLYVAQTPDKQLVLIKFARRYSIELHEFCAKLGHAPPILAFEKLPGEWCGVAMEYNESGLPITDLSLPPAHRNRWATELRRLMDAFHRKGFVHGDLRDANVIRKGDSVTLTDFDWGDTDGEVFYPTLNPDDELLRVASDDRRRL